MLRFASCLILDIVSGINSHTVLWYASRATGVVALLLMTAVLLLGLLVTRQGRLPGLPRFAVTGLHRNLSLVAVVFVVLHVLTAVADSYVHIPLISAVVPLASSYERLALGLGAASLDIMIAVIVTSLLRRHLSRRLWRAVHLLAYVSWPVAWLHSITSSTDLRHGWLFFTAVGCALLVVIAVLWRLSAASRDVPRAERVGLLMAAVHDRTALKDKLTGRGTASAQERISRR
jgi:predicted ferric reductase